MTFNLRSLLLLVCVFCACFQTSALGQTAAAEQEARAKTWNDYQLPAADFVRFVDQKQGYSLWRPAGWKESATGGGTTFSAGEKWPQVRVFTTEVPDGYSAANFATAILQQWRQEPIRLETVVVRRVLLGGADGREFTFEVEDEPGHTLRETVWLTTLGPRAYIFYFLAEPEEQEKYEPYFKRMMLSLRVGAAGHWTEEFETLRARFAGGAAAKAGREIEAAQLAETLRTGREPVEIVSVRLTALAREAPAAVMDLLTDYDPQVRAAAIAALSGLEDARMTEVLVWALSDKDGYASAMAARAVAGRGAAGLTALKSKLTTLSREPGAILRIAALLKEEEARELAQELFKSDESASQLAGLHMALVLPLKGLVLPIQKLLASDRSEVVLATVAALRLRHATDAVPELLRFANGDTEHRAVRALAEIAPAEVGERFKARIKEIDARLASLKGAEGQRPPAARNRNRTGNAPPSQRSAARQRPAGIANAAAPTPITDDELYENEVTAFRELASAGWLPLREFKALPERVRLAVLRGELVVASEKIELRDRYMRATDKQARQAVYQEALQRPGLGFWARLALQPTFEPGAAFTLDTSSLVDAPTTGETLFPQNATLYLLAPDFKGTLSRLDEALGGVQMEGVRDQMTFALILKSLKARLASAVGAEAMSDVGAGVGVDLKAPLSLAVWPASEGEGDPLSRSAVVLRVTDRSRFERTLMLYQNGVGGFYSFAVMASAGARFMEALPALFPLAMAGGRFLPASAGGTLGATPRGPSPVYIRREQWGGLLVTVFEKLNLYDSSAAGREPIYVAYLGSTAVLAPTRAALIDLLKAAEKKRPSIKENKAYARALAEEGEIKFFSQPAALLTDSPTETKEQADPMWQKLTAALGHETGALRLSSSTWETIFHLDFTDRDLTGSITHFKAQELAAPRELLPADTIFYTGAKLEPSRLWGTLKGLGLMTARNSLDDGEVEKRVTPKLQGEVSIALISLSTALDRTRGEAPSFLIALKLKDAELANLHRSGQLFRKAMLLPGVSTLASPVASVPDGTGRLYLAVTDDYLLMANEVEALKRLEAKEKLSTTRDYKRSVSATTESLALFATYSPDAAFKDVQSAAKDAPEQMAWSALSALVHAFHSQRAVVSVNGNVMEGRLAVSFDREGRFSVGEVTRGAGEFDVANALITPKGLNIAEPKRTASLRLRVTAKQPDVVARVRDDVAKFPWQKIESANDAGLVFSVEARRIPEKQTIQLPVNNLAEMAPYLRSTTRIDRSAPQVVKLAKEIAGNDRDGRSVAHKLGEWTFKNLTWKRVESSNVETLASREADCLEHSELYVALARSLGLPARVVSGAAFAGGSFGAHAWVEIYLGRWVEVDPTWGMMDYVDSTHLRFDGDSFASYAMLNQLQLEVLEARSFVADYQRDPARLVKEWGASEEGGTRAFVFHYALAAEQALGTEAFRKLEERQSAAVIQAFERAVASEEADWSWGAQVRVLSSEVKDARAHLLVLRGDDLLRVEMALRDGAWFITEIEDTDYGIPTFADALRGALRPGTSRLQTLSFTPERALKQLAQLATTEGESPQLLLMKAIALRRKEYRESLDRDTPEEDKEKAGPQAQESEAAKAFRQITERWPDFAPAQYGLAVQLLSYDEEPEKAVEPLRRFAKLMPLDPRPWTRLGEAFEQLKRFGEAEAAYREAATLDRDNYEAQVTLAAFYFKRAQTAKAAESVAQAIKLAPDTDSAFDAVSCEVLGIDVEGDREGHKRLEELLLIFGKELAQSKAGLRRLAHAQSEQQKYDAALQTLQRVVALGAEAWDYTSMARDNRSAGRFALALGAADQALKLNGEYSGAHFERACALARLGRTREAVASLKRALELDPELSESLDSNDRKLVDSLPEFKKLLEEKSAEDEGPAAQQTEKSGDAPAPRN